jgi:chlorobactene glucosyltransferase
MPSIIDYFSVDLIIHLIFFQSVILVIALWNMLLSYRTRRHSIPDDPPKVSVLIPARNEEENIAACVFSLLDQDYPNFELIVLDDQSTDQTRTILDEIAQNRTELTVIAGQPAAENLTGKNWACSQLALQAKGDLFFFSDADTIHQPRMLSSAVAALMGEEADLITGHPKQILGSVYEELLVPFFSWVVLVFFPLGVAYNIKSPIFTTAVGQMMLFKRTAYLEIGGHAGVSSSIVDDLSLARKIHTSGFRWRVAYISDLISCRMYRTSQGALDGFTKNLFAAFEFRLLPFLFAFLWLGILFLEPLLLLILKALGRVQFAQLDHLLLCIGLSIAVWIIPYFYLKLPVRLAFVYPITIIAIGITALRSLRASLRGELVWKNRVIQPSHWKWF